MWEDGMKKLLAYGGMGFLAATKDMALANDDAED